VRRNGGALMALSQKLELRQGQQLVMTPQLQQAIKLLQLSNLELAEYVESELESNPLLDRDDTSQGEMSIEAAGQSEPQGEDGEAQTETAASPGEESLDFESRPALAELDGGHDNLYPDDPRSGPAQAGPGPADSGWSSVQPSQSSRPFAADDFNLESVVASEKTLAEHLTEQLNMAVADPARRMIGRHLIDMLDEAGYVAGDLDALCERLGAAPALVTDTLLEMQCFEPAGVFARDLAECLAIQLAERDRLDPAMRALLDNIEVLAKHDFKALKRLCGVDQDDLVDMIAEIRELNPKPGLAWGSVMVQPIVPDVFVRAGADGGWVVELNSETLPKVLVNNQYHATVNASATKDEDKTYISECYANASWLVKSLEQRARTILKVSREIVRQQDGFLAYGVEYLKPLKLKDVAEEISMHESTVSRVTTNKYMATPRGLFELKYFFTSAIASADGGAEHSAESVRHRIKTLIDAESADAVLSDDEIVRRLRADGIDIARRTVAKYREAMSVPSSVERRRQKKAFA